MANFIFTIRIVLFFISFLYTLCTRFVQSKIKGPGPPTPPFSLSFSHPRIRGISGVGKQKSRFLLFNCLSLSLYFFFKLALELCFFQKYPPRFDYLCSGCPRPPTPASCRACSAPNVEQPEHSVAHTVVSCRYTMLCAITDTYRHTCRKQRDKKNDNDE